MIAVDVRATESTRPTDAGRRSAGPTRTPNRTDKDKE